MFNFNGMPYKRSGRAGGKSVSMIGMLVLLLAALLVLPSCDDTETVEVEGPETIICNGVEVADRNAPECQAAEDDDDYLDATGGTADRYSMGGDFDDMLAGDDEADYIEGGLGDDSIKGMGGDDSLKGGGGADTIYGGDDDDVLTGGTGDDTLDGGAGDDTLDGGAGDDELTGGSGNNTLDGGEGDGDIAIYKDAMQVTVDLRSGKARVQHEPPATGSGYISLEDSADSGTGNDTLTNIENVKGTHRNDIIDGDDNANLLKGLDGADMINGHGGDDTILPNRPAGVNDMGVAEANTAAADSTDFEYEDEADVVDGGEGSDTISYEGESATVEVDLSAVVEAVEDTSGDNAPDNSVIAHVRATVATVVDMIKVVNISTDPDDANIVSTIENVTGGFGRDTLTGDDRSNTLSGGDGDDTLSGGDGDDTLSGGDGDDTLSGGDGDDTYMAVEAGDTVTEGPEEGMDTVHYATLEDAETMPRDESVVADIILAANVEVVVGTPNVDNLTAANTAVTILGLGGNDNLTGNAGDDTLIGCAGENTLAGAAGDDVFGVFNDGTNADTITDFAEGDEIHLKGFDAGAVTITKIADNTTQAAVNVGGVIVAKVTSTFAAIVDDDSTDANKARTIMVGALIDALGEDNDAGDAVVRMVEFDSAKCGSN